MSEHSQHKVYFVGAGGIGMSALARYFLSRGYEVAGYDRVSTRLTDQLSREGAKLIFEDDPLQLPEGFDSPEEVLVIYTPAIPKDSRLLNYFTKGDYRVIKRSVALGEAFNTGRGIAVAGTHGKTSISTMLSHLLLNSPLGCNAFLGGISKNTGSNLVLTPSSDYMVAEADEYDRSFLTLYPDMALVSSMDADHLDIYGDTSHIRESFEDFISQITASGTLILKHGLDPKVPEGLKVLSYSTETTKADYHLLEIVQEGPVYRYTVGTPSGPLPVIRLQVPGILNVENSLGAIALAHQLGVSGKDLASALSTYQGVERRFDVQLMGERIYIDDYAHHPTEITAFLNSVRGLFPGRKLTGIFQPHLFSRTRDFADDFARSLELLDELILLQIYPAREEPIEGVDSAMLLDKVNMKEKVLIDKDQLLRVLAERDPEVLLTMGAGDINQFVEPLKNWMEKLR